MTPSHIRLFDGIRVTTEHLDHLQAAFLTAISDLRLLHTEFPVVAGFEVTVQDNQVTVEPGLAFDFEGQRIFCDVPQTFELESYTDHTDLFVLAEYRQTETGEIEGKFTLVWDSCEVYLSDAEVGEDQNTVVLAKLERTGTGIEVESSEDYYVALAELAESHEGVSPGDVLEAEMSDVEDDEVSDDDLESSEPDTEASISLEDIEGGGEATVPTDATEAGDEVAAESAALPTKPQQVHVSQGFERLEENPMVDLAGLMLSDLRAMVDTDTAAPSWLLKQHSIALLFSPVSITAQTEATAIVQIESAPDTDTVPPTEGSNASSPVEMSVDHEAVRPNSSSFRLQSNSTAEVSIEQGSLEQMSTSHVTGYGHTRAFLRNGQINHLPLFGALNEGDEQLPLSLQVRLLHSEEHPVVEVRLVWDGDVTDAQVSWLESAQAVLTWAADVAWKAADITGIP